MQVISGHIAGSADLGNGVVLFHRIANLRQELAAMGVKGAIPAAVVDDQIIAVADMVASLYDCAGLHRQNRRTVGIGNVQTVVVGGILTGNADIFAFAKERSNVLFPVWVIEWIAKSAAGGRGGISSLSRSNPIRCLVRLDMYLVIHLELIIL